MESSFKRYPPQTNIDRFVSHFAGRISNALKKKSIVFTVSFQLTHTHSSTQSSSKIHTATYIFTYPVNLTSTSTLTQQAKSKKKLTHHPIPVAIARKHHSQTNQNKPTLREVVGDPLVN